MIAACIIFSSTGCLLVYHTIGTALMDPIKLHMLLVTLQQCSKPHCTFSVQLGHLEVTGCIQNGITCALVLKVQDDIAILIAAQLLDFFMQLHQVDLSKVLEKQEVKNQKMLDEYTLTNALEGSKVVHHTLSEFLPFRKNILVPMLSSLSYLKVQVSIFENVPSILHTILFNAESGNILLNQGGPSKLQDGLIWKHVLKSASFELDHDAYCFLPLEPQGAEDCQMVTLRQTKLNGIFIAVLCQTTQSIVSQLHDNARIYSAARSMEHQNTYTELAENHGAHVVPLDMLLGKKWKEAKMDLFCLGIFSIPSEAIANLVDVNHASTGCNPFKAQLPLKDDGKPLALEVGM